MKPTVVLTRPEGSNTALQARLVAGGWSLISQPLLTIEALPEDERAAAPELGDGDVCVYISANAVRMGFPLLGDAAKKPGVKHLAVGERSAEALAMEGISAIIPERSDSEGLLSLPALQAVQGRRVVIIKGERGRGLLADVLRERGAEVIEFECYRRVAAEFDEERFSSHLASQGALLFQANSGETLELLTDVLVRCGQSALLQHPVVVPSGRVAEMAAGRGWHRVITAGNAGDEAFMAVLESDQHSAESETSTMTQSPDNEASSADDVTASDAAGHTDSAMATETAAADRDNNPSSVNADATAKAVQSASPAVAAASTTRDAAPRRSDTLARFLVLLVLIALIAGAGWAYQTLWPQWQQRDTRVVALEQQLQALSAQQRGAQEALESRVAEQLTATQSQARSRLEAQLADEARARAEQQQRLRQYEQRLERLDIRLARLTATDRRAWLANEAAFLVRLAAQRLLATRDIAVAQALLDNADGLLAEVSDPRLDSARRALAVDRAALAAAPRVDVAGLYARFSALIGQAAALQVVEPQAAVKAPAADAPWLERAEAGWQAALAKLSDYLVVRRRDAEMARMMTPDWEALARQNLRMLLEQAQIAALSANQGLYTTALERAAVFVAEFEATDPDRVRALNAALAELAALDIAPAVPDLVHSRAALADAIRLIDSDSPPANPASQVQALDAAPDTGH